MIKGVKLDVYDAGKVAGSGAPGTVLSIAPDGVTIACSGGAILAKRVKAPEGKKIAAAEYAAAVGLKVGDRFDAPTPKPAA